MSKVIFWDFDGTLARRPRGWSGTIFDILREFDPSTRLTRMDFVPLVNKGFPWHTPDVPHPELSTDDLWWQRIEGIIARAYVELGIDEEISHMLSRRFRSKYLDLAGWVVYDDVRPTLIALAERGWRHIILSNHVPELPWLVEALGLGSCVEHVITSARTAFEKPREEMFRIALAVAGMPESCWMVGDNPDADVLGAEKAGIKGILVRRSDPRVARTSEDLRGVMEIVGEGGDDGY